ncbi:LysR substrate-binding domain-containing protein [Arthrobacter sp. MA-N2]|uniref:LysR substrate-binding domain-containing protein n=1 Tax=Arthrobacter sp. MA-N2 TaxID=1101188 RepID=UPI0009DDCFC0|nr:LysR substrate-binding domain-containing protein [Arthrobacter sp. MA-N2]
MYDLRRLQILRELHHRGTLSAVATALSYSTSAISQQLSQLESEVGVRLLEPDGRRVRLTAQARILVAHAETILNQLEEARSDIAASLDVISGTLRVAGFQTAALNLLPEVIAWVTRTYQEVEVLLTQAEPDEAIPGVLAREFDLAIVESFPGQPLVRSEAIEQHLLFEDAMRLGISASDPRARFGLSLEQLAEDPWIMEPAGTPAREWAVDVCRKAGFEPRVQYESPDMFVHQRFASQGLALAFLPDLMWANTRPDVSLHLLRPGMARTVYTVVRAGAGGHPVIRAFHDALMIALNGTTSLVMRNLQAAPGSQSSRVPNGK